MLSHLRNSKVAALAALLMFSLAPAGITPIGAQERYPEVARLSFVSGGVTFSRGDDPDEWDDALENVPLAAGDRIFSPADGRAEIQLSSGNFVRLAPRSYFSTLNLSEDIKQFYLGEGAASFRLRRLASDEVIEVGTPNVSVTFEEPGQYRVIVEDNGDSRIRVRSGRAVLAAGGRQITVENSEIRIYGMDAPRYDIVGLPASDDFDRWVADRDARYERDYADASRYASEDIIGAEDLAGHGRWEQIPDYGYAWTPTIVAVGWMPFSNGRWYWQDPWGWNWISHERWGWATSHYGRWVPYRSRWYWVPVRPRTRVRYAPACVEFVRVRDHVGWFPLHPRDRSIPWWERRDRRFDRDVTYYNRNHVTVINHNYFISGRPVNRYIVRDTVIVRDARAAHFAESLPIPNRSSLRLTANEGQRRGFKPSDQVLSRAAVLRTAPPLPSRRFQDKLPEIQKNQGNAVAPARMFASREEARPVRVRPAAEIERGELAPRDPKAASSVAGQPVTESRGKKLAVREPSDKAAPVKPEPKTSAPKAQPSAEAVKRPELREPQKVQPQKQQPDRPSSPRTWEQQRLEELERQQAQQAEAERKAQAQRRQEQERQNAVRQQQLRQAQEKKQQQSQDERKAQALQQQEQSRREQAIRQQQQVVERQAREQQRLQQELDRKQVQQQREQPAPAPQLRQQPAPVQRELQPAPRPQEQRDQRAQPARPQPQERPAPQPQTLRPPGQS